MASKSPTERSKIAKIGAFALHSRYDARTTTATARAVGAKKLDQRLLAEIDPEGLLEPDEAARRLRYARSAYFAGLARRRHTTPAPERRKGRR